MTCIKCYWCTLNRMLSNERVCCNEESKHYNRVFTKEEAEAMICEFAEAKEDIAYRNNMLIDEFASRHYV